MKPLLRRSGALLVVLALAAAACTGSQATTTTSERATTTSPGPTTSTAPPASTTTTVARLPEGPVTLPQGPSQGTTVSYDHEATYRLNASGDIDPEDVTVEVTGERTFSWFPGQIEAALDPRRIEVAGVVGLEERDAGGQGRDALQAAAHDPTLLELPTVLEIGAAGTPTGGRTPVPLGLIDPLGLAAALDAFPPPPVPDGPVTVGERWDLDPAVLPLVGPGYVTATSGWGSLRGFSQEGEEVVAEVVAAIELQRAAAGFAEIAAAVLDLGTAERRLAGVEARLELPLLENDVAAEGDGERLELVAGAVTIAYRVRLSDGVVTHMDRHGEVRVAATFVDRGEEINGAYVISTSSTSELDRIDDAPPPVDLDPDDLALEAFPPEIDGYAYEDVPPEAADPILSGVGLLLDGLPGIGGLRAVRSADEAVVDVLAFLPTSGVRGDPGLVQAVASVATGGLDAGDDTTVVAGVPVSRIEVDQDTWWMWQSNTRLLIAIGSEGAVREVLEALISWNRAEYLWQEGDCLDFGSGDTFDPPFSPFGDDNLVPCYRPHTLEVVATTVLDDGPEAGFPEDMSVRSDLFCGDAFLEFSGALAVETVLAELRYLPDELEWEEGDRYLGCTISDVDEGGNIVHASGSLRDTGPDRPLVLEAGTCRDGSLTSAPVDCDTPHAVEAIGTITLPDGPGAPFPGHEEFREQADALCQELLEDYAATLTVDNVELEAFVTVVDAHLWEIGRRELPCLASAADRDGIPQRVAGSFAGTWVPLGTEGQTA